MYAARLLLDQFTTDEANRMSRTLAWGYPDHGFVVDIEEAVAVGLKARELSVDEMRIVDAIFMELDQAKVPTVVGHLEEVADGD